MPGASQPLGGPCAGRSSEDLPGARPRGSRPGTRAAAASERDRVVLRTHHAVLTAACTHAHAHVLTHAHPHTHAHTGTHARTRAPTHVHTFTHAHTRSHAHRRTHVHPHAHTLTHVHTRTHAHSHVHTPTRAHPPPHTHAHTRTHTPPRTCTHAHLHPRSQDKYVKVFAALAAGRGSPRAQRGPEPSPPAALRLPQSSWTRGRAAPAAPRGSRSPVVSPGPGGMRPRFKPSRDKVFSQAG